MKNMGSLQWKTVWRSYGENMEWNLYGGLWSVEGTAPQDGEVKTGRKTNP